MNNQSALKWKLALLPVFIFIHFTVHAQVSGIAINDDNTSADPSAMLDVSLNTTSAKKGILIPRISNTQRDNIVSPANALLIFNTTINSFEYNAGTASSPVWVSLLCTVTGWRTVGNSGTTAGTNFIGTTDNTGLAFKVNNINAGFIDQSPSSNNLYFGTYAGNYSSTTGINNTALGSSALAVNSNGSNNTSIGYQSLYSASTGSNNTAVGYGANVTVSSVSNSTLAGYNATANAGNAVAVGANATANNTQATAIGNGAQANGSNATAIGNGATTSQNNALILGNTSANVGIGTSTPNTGTKLDVAGSFKLGSNGSVYKNDISFSASISTTVAAPTTSILTILGLNVLGSYAAGVTDVVVTIPATQPTTAQAVVAVSPAFDLPGSVSIASARAISTTQVKIRFLNAGSTSQSVSGTFYISVKEF